jgi:hypothetical protein
MKRATITLPDELEQALASYLDDQKIPLALTSVVQTALRDYLSERGYLAPAQPLRITPAAHGSGQTDVSVHHDRYFTEE